jgi:hypothetical protein
MTDFLALLERDPESDPARAARGQCRRSAAAWLITSSGDALGVLMAADLDGSMLLGLDAGAAPGRDAEVNVALADPGPGAASYRSLQTVRLGTADDPRHLNRFLNRHPEARASLDAGRIGLYCGRPLAVQLLRTGTAPLCLDAAAYLLDFARDPEFTEQEQVNLMHQNSGHLDINLQLATQMLGEPEGRWLLTGLDPEGLDLRCGERRCRLPFPSVVSDRKSMGDAIKAYVKEARARLGIQWQP